MNITTQTLGDVSSVVTPSHAAEPAAGSALRGLLVQCIRKVYAGEEWLEKRSVSLALEKLLGREAEKERLQALLTPREMELLLLAAGGLRNREIADRLFIIEGTVKVHLHKISDKLQVKNRVWFERAGQGIWVDAVMYFKGPHPCVVGLCIILSHESLPA